MGYIYTHILSNFSKGGKGKFNMIICNYGNK